MQFDKESYLNEEMTLDGITIHYRAYRNLVYVDKPVNREYQSMNLFVPEDFYAGKKINGYDLNSAPVFMPNTVGGYMPGEADEPGYPKFGPKEPNAVFRALQHGYVVAAPAIRGRVQKGENGEYNGKAPACLVDYKAAVRYLHYFSPVLPGDESKIITNGTSAGGALSSLMGSTGCHRDYEPYLEEIGAADAGDDVFAASCYCPIMNLDHGDMAYEWEFSGVYDYHRMNMEMDKEGQRVFIPVDGEMTEEQIRVSTELAAMFPSYVNSLSLKDEEGNSLTLNQDGNGSFKEYVKNVVLQSAQRALDKGIDITEKNWLTVNGSKAEDMDFEVYVKDITRMKSAPAFDDLSLQSPENDLFGTAAVNCQHFTEYGKQHGKENNPIADKKIVKMLNPMYYIEDDSAVKAKYFRIRHGECDRDTSLAISAMLTLKLRECGCEVDYHSPWNVPHAGDYDLDELFAWIDEICKK